MNHYKGEQVIGVQCIRNVVQPPPLFHPKTFPSPQNKTQYPLSSYSSFPLPLSDPGNYQSADCLYGFACSSYFI